MPLWFRKNIGWLTIIALCLLPIIRWFFIMPLSIRFFDFNSLTTSLGQITGLAGMTLFSLNLIMSSRLKFLDKYFYGLNMVYTYHRAVGALAFSLLLYHPLFLVVKYIQISLRQAALFLLPSGNFAVTYGIIALLLMIGLIATTFYARIKYQTWKLSHKFMVVVFIFACLHVLYTSSDTSRDPVLRFYVLGLAALGLIAVCYRVIVNKFYNQNPVYRIREVVELNQKSISLELVPAGRALSFLPGQFVFTSFLSDQVGPESHPFSIASAPADSGLKLVIKSLGDHTGELKNLAVGDRVSIEGPFGKFSYKNFSGKNQIWIAGGIGISPFLGMANDLPGENYKIDLYYCTKDQDEAVLTDELLKISSLKKNFKVISWYSDERGRITAKDIRELSQGLKDKEILLCGPVLFMKSLRKQLIESGVPRRNIHWEKFNLI